MITAKTYTVQLILGGYEFTSEDISMTSLTVTESVQLSLPSIVIEGTMPEIKYKDLVTSDKVEGKLIISKIVKNDTVELVKIPVRVFNCDIESNMTTVSIKLTLIYNWEFALNSNTYYLTASSSNVFRALGISQGFFKTYISPSSDTMTWINPNKRGLIFLNEVASAAYASPKSCFLWGVRADNSLIYRDISVDSSLLQKKLYLGSGDNNVALGYKLKSEVLMLNSSYGYGRNTDVYDYENNTIKTSLGDVMIEKEGSLATISKGQSQGSWRSSINLDNTHSNYQRAILQNLRVKSSYNNRLVFNLYDDNTDIELLDDIVVINNTNNYSTIDRLCGVVSQRIINFNDVGMHYSIVVETNGFNAKGL